MGVAFREASSVRRPRRIGGWSQEPQEHKEAQDETLSPSLAFARSQTPSSIGQVGAERSDWLGLYDSSSTTTYKSIVVTMPPAKIMRKSNVETSMAGVAWITPVWSKLLPLDLSVQKHLFATHAYSYQTADWLDQSGVLLLGSAFGRSVQNLTWQW